MRTLAGERRGNLQRAEALGSEAGAPCPAKVWSALRCRQRTHTSRGWSDSNSVHDGYRPRSRQRVSSLMAQPLPGTIAEPGTAQGCPPPAASPHTHAPSPLPTAAKPWGPDLSPAAASPPAGFPLQLQDPPPPPRASANSTSILILFWGPSTEGLTDSRPS